MSDLFEPAPSWPEPVLLSIYNQYPRKTGRPQALKRISEALDRICQGEIDGQPRTQAEAVEFLRLKVEEARRQLGAREQKFIPLPTTWFNGRRYLRPELAQAVEKPKRLGDCISVLCEYPNMPNFLNINQNIDAFLPALMAIDKALEGMTINAPEDSHGFAINGINALRRLRSRTEIFAMAVKEWPVEELKFVPNPAKWFSESRFNQNEETWNRKPANGFEQERQQLGRVMRIQ